MPDKKIIPPRGYVLDGPASSGTIRPPAGYMLDQSQAVQSQPPVNPSAQQGFFSSAADASGLPGLLHMGAQVLRHPIDSAETAAGFAGDVGRAAMHPNSDTAATSTNPITLALRRLAQNSVQNVQQGVSDYRKTGMSQQTRRDFVNAIPIAGPALKQAQAQSDAGNTAGGVGTMLGLAGGLALPEILKGAPTAAGNALGLTGEALQDSGANRMDRFINGLKKLPVGEYNKPGRAVLESGPETSFVANRPQLTQNIAAAKAASGPAIDAAAASAAGRVAIPDVADAVDSTIQPMRNAATGPGNAQPTLPARLDSLRNTFEPGISQPGDISAADALDLRRQLDKSIDWNRGADGVDLTIKNAQRQIRGKINDLLYQAAPEVQAPSARFGDLSDAFDLSEKNQNIPPFKLNSLSRDVVDALAFGAGTAAHGPAFGAGMAATTHLAPMLWKLPFTQTGLATAAYQAGKGLSYVGDQAIKLSPAVQSFVDSLNPAVQRVGLPALSPNLGLTSPSNPSQNNENSPSGNYGGPQQQSQQSTPPGGNAYSVRLQRLPVAPPTLAPGTAARLTLPNPAAGAGQPILKFGSNGPQMNSQPWPASAVPSSTPAPAPPPPPPDRPAQQRPPTPPPHPSYPPDGQPSASLAVPALLQRLTGGQQQPTDLASILASLRARTAA